MGGDVDRVWTDSMPDLYERFLVPAVFEPFAIDLAGRVARLAPERVLELAAGTGVLTRALVAQIPAAQITATDLSDGMVELGCHRAPAATWRQADAMALPFEVASFDAIVCQFGVMFFPDRAAAFRDAYRVLAPGGSLVMNVWGPLEAHAFQSALVAGLEQAFPDDAPTFMGLVVHAYSDPEIALADLAEAGFGSVTVDTVTLEGRSLSATDLAKGYCGGTPLRAGIAERGADLSTVTATVAEVMAGRLGTGPVRGTMTAHIVSACRTASTKESRRTD